MTKKNVDARDLAQLTEILFVESHFAGRAPLLIGAKGLVVDSGMWNEANENERVAFTNLARIHSLPYRLLSVAKGAPYLTDEWETEAAD